MSRPVFRLLTVAAVAAVSVGLTALPALAHVTAVPGRFERLLNLGDLLVAAAHDAVACV